MLGGALEPRRGRGEHTAKGERRDPALGKKIVAQKKIPASEMADVQRC